MISAGDLWTARLLRDAPERDRRGASGLFRRRGAGGDDSELPGQH